MHDKPFNVIYLVQAFQFEQYSSQINQYCIHCDDVAFEKPRKQEILYIDYQSWTMHNSIHFKSMDFSQIIIQQPRLKYALQPINYL